MASNLESQIWSLLDSRLIFARMFTTLKNEMPGDDLLATVGFASKSLNPFDKIWSVG